MYTVTFKYKQGELVYVDFDGHKIIGRVESFRLSSNKNLPLYKVSNVDMYVPETMVNSLTEEQKQFYEVKYEEYMSKTKDYEEKIIDLKEKLFNLNEDCF